MHMIVEEELEAVDYVDKHCLEKPLLGLGGETVPKMMLSEAFADGVLLLHSHTIDGTIIHIIRQDGAVAQFIDTKQSFLNIVL